MTGALLAVLLTSEAVTRYESSTEIAFAECSVTYVVKRYDPKRHQASVRKTEPFIDGQRAFGMDWGDRVRQPPRRYVSQVIVLANGRKVVLDELVRGLCDPSMERRQIWFDPETKVLSFGFEGGDGAGGYSVIFDVKAGERVRRRVFFESDLIDDRIVKLN